MLRKVLTQTYQEIAADTVFSDVVPQLNKIMDLLNKNTGSFNEDEWLERFMAEMAFFDKLSQVPDDSRLRIFQNKLKENIQNANLVYDQNDQDEQIYLPILERLKDKIEEEMIAEQNKIDEDPGYKNHCDNDERELRIKLLAITVLKINDIKSSFAIRLANILGIKIKQVEPHRQFPKSISNTNSPDSFKPTGGRMHWPSTYSRSENLFFPKEYVRIYDEDKLMANSDNQSKNLVTCRK